MANREIKLGWVVGADGTVGVMVPHSHLPLGYAVRVEADENAHGRRARQAWEPIEDSDPRIADADRARLGNFLACVRRERGVVARAVPALAEIAAACEAEGTPLRVPAMHEAECLECGATYPPEKAHLVDAGGMGCYRCNH